MRRVQRDSGPVITALTQPRTPTAARYDRHAAGASASRPGPSSIAQAGRLNARRRLDAHSNKFEGFLSKIGLKRKCVALEELIQNDPQQSR
jgi:hypothetical protein